MQRNLVFKRLILFEGLTGSSCFVKLVSEGHTHTHTRVTTMVTYFFHVFFLLVMLKFRPIIGIYSFVISQLCVTCVLSFLSYV